MWPELCSWIYRGQVGTSSLKAEVHRGSMEGRQAPKQTQTRCTRYVRSPNVQIFRIIPFYVYLHIVPPTNFTLWMTQWQ